MGTGAHKLSAFSIKRVIPGKKTVSQTCAPDPAPAPLPFSGHARVIQGPFWSEGPKTEPTHRGEMGRCTLGINASNPAQANPTLHIRRAPLLSPLNVYPFY
ncbi:unnamed protein product [Bubo scandiacus]